MGMRRGLVAVLCLLFLTGGGILGYTMGRSGARVPEAAGQGAEVAAARTAAFDPGQRDSINETVTRSRRNAITRVVAAASPAVVGINVVELQQVRQWSPWGDDPFFRHFFGDRTYTQRVQGLGSGFLVSPDGYILTNDHVAGNAREIKVTLTSGEEYAAEIVGTDAVTDVCLLKIKGRELPYLPLGSSDDVIIGEWVIALGNPFGLFALNDKPTVTVGVVSNTGVVLRAGEGRVYRGMIQTDAAINSGNSGGPLVNTAGEVIGMNSVIYTPNQGSIGLGFAVPVNRVKAVMAELRKNGRIEREFWTGLEIQSVDARIARLFGLEKAEGVVVTDVRRRSPAERGGFKVGDIITVANGTRVMDEDTLMELIQDARVGDELALSVLRDRKPLQLKLRLEKRPT